MTPSKLPAVDAAMTPGLHIARPCRGTTEAERWLHPCTCIRKS